MFFNKKKENKASSYQLGFSDGYTAGLRGNAKVFQATFNKDRGYIIGYEQGYRKGITEYRNRQSFNDKKIECQPINNSIDVRSKTNAQREINLGTNNFRKL